VQIYYSEGPPTVSMGAAGIFVKDEPREVEDELARLILNKKSIRFMEAKKTMKGSAVAPQEEVALG